LEPDLEHYEEVRDFVRSAYVHQVGEAELLDHALHGMVEALDPYSRYFGEREVASLTRETRGQFMGIGVVFLQPTARGRVLFSLPDSPAERAGIGVGDRLLTVEGRLVENMLDGELQATLADPDRGSISMTVIGSAGGERALRLEREELVDPSVRHVRMLDEERDVAYVAVTSFSQATPEEFDRELARLRDRGLRGLIVDLRGNLGGVLRSAVRLANRFVAEGLVVSHEGRGDPVLYLAESAEATYANLPLAVLVDGSSASASEVFAAAIQEHRAGVVVGSPTYGKGMVQEMRTFAAVSSVVKLTSSYYYTPSHRNLERTVERAWDCGVLPDLAVGLGDAETRAVHEFLASYSPPGDALERLRAWEDQEHLRLVPEPPPDPQLEAALGLFRGERPGSHLTLIDR